MPLAGTVKGSGTHDKTGHHCLPNDPNGKLPFALKPPAAGAPTTVIYGKDGTERGRLSGGADWSGADAQAVIARLADER